MHSKYFFNMLVIAGGLVLTMGLQATAWSQAADKEKKTSAGSTRKVPAVNKISDVTLKRGVVQGQTTGQDKAAQKKKKKKKKKRKFNQGEVLIVGSKLRSVSIPPQASRRVEVGGKSVISLPNGQQIHIFRDRRVHILDAKKRVIRQGRFVRWQDTGAQQQGRAGQGRAGMRSYSASSDRMPGTRGRDSTLPIGRNRLELIFSE